jgi:hypothetical protein
MQGEIASVVFLNHMIDWVLWPMVLGVYLFMLLQRFHRNTRSVRPLGENGSIHSAFVGVGPGGRPMMREDVGAPDSKHLIEQTAP